MRVCAIPVTQATLRRNYDDAKKCYQLAINRCGSSRSFLCAALLFSKVGLEDDARECFSAGVVAHRNDATLLQAWGLFESKCGALSRATRLLQRAVVLDPSLHKVLSWSRFRDHPSGLPQRRTARSGLQPAMSVGDATALAIAIPRPRVKYTVPMSARGWKGRIEEGEDPAAWYDAEGRRKGPPANYWRQSMDERTHSKCLAAVDALVGGDGGSAGALDEDALRALEVRMSIQNPMRNRKLLGRWAPIVVDGEVVARAACSLEGRGAPAGGYECSAPTLEVFRLSGPKTIEHRYGVIDVHMEEGERIAIVANDNDKAAPARSSAVFEATQLNARRLLPWEASSDAEDGVYVGGVTLLNDYLLVARDSESSLREVYLRIAIDEQDDA